MKKVRYYLAVFALAAALSGPFLPVSTSMANAASGRHAGSSVAAGQSTRAIVSVHRYPICPVPGSIDC